MPQLKQQPVTPISEMTVILGALNALKRGDSGVRLPLDWTGVSGRVADVFRFRNGKIAQFRTFAERADALKWAGIEE